jgi:hypothetical protein
LSICFIAHKLLYLYIIFYSRELDLPATCTLRANRVEKCPLKTEKALQKEGREALDSQVSEEGILIVKWFDNKEMTVGTNYCTILSSPQVSIFIIIL